MQRSSLRVVDHLWGISLLTWAVLRAQAGIDPVPVRAAVAALHVLIAILFLLRRPAYASLSLSSMGAVLPSFAVGLVAVSTAPLPIVWPKAVQVLFVIGAGLTIVSFVYLGRAFGVFPAHRGVVARGPYRCIRHPGYLGECLMLAAVCLVIHGGAGGLLALATAIAFVVRIRFEESVLAHSRRYLAYRRRSAYRLIPWIW